MTSRGHGEKRQDPISLHRSEAINKQTFPSGAPVPRLKNETIRNLGARNWMSPMPFPA